MIVQSRRRLWTRVSDGDKVGNERVKEEEESAEKKTTGLGNFWHLHVLLTEETAGCWFVTFTKFPPLLLALAGVSPGRHGCCSADRC